MDLQDSRSHIFPDPSGSHGTDHQRIQDVTAHATRELQVTTLHNKAVPFFFLEEGGKRWNSLVYIGIQCYTNTAVKPQFVQWSYELEWMLEYDTRSYSFTASVSPNKIPLSIPAQLVQQQLILQICTRSEQFSLGNLNNGRN